MEDISDIDVLKKRLKKALQVAEKLKKDSLLEHEVNKELARRNETLKKDMSACEERLNAAKSSLFSMDSNVRLLVKLTEELSSNRVAADENESSMLQDIKSTQQNCLASCQTMKSSLFTQQELTAEITKAEKAKADIAAGKAAKAAAQAQHESMILSQMQLAASEDANEESEDEARSRTESRGRATSMTSSMKPRRNSSIFIRLPDNMGTSLIRKSADVLPTSQMLNASIVVGEGSGIEAEDGLAPELGVPDNRKNGATVSFLDESTTDFGLEDIDMSKLVAANESMYVEPVDTSKVALFEHFIVVGASEEVAIEFAHQLQSSYDENTLSTIFKNTFGGFFNANRATVATSTATAAALVKQKSAQQSGSNKADDRTAKAAVNDSNRRRSFGLGGVTATAAPAVTPAAPVAPVETTPVRTAGMFSYFMRSPPTAGATDAGTDKSKNSTKPSPLDNKTFKGPQTNELDSILEFNKLVDTVKVEPGDITPGKPRPVRKYIYGDDNSEHGSNSNHSSSDLVAAASGVVATGEMSPPSGPLRSSVSRNSSDKQSPSAERLSEQAHDGSLIDFEESTHVAESSSGILIDLMSMEDGAEHGAKGGPEDQRLSEGDVDVPLRGSVSEASNDGSLHAASSSGSLSRFGGAVMSSLYGMSNKPPAISTSAENLAAAGAISAPNTFEKKDGESESSSGRVESTDSSDTIGGYFFGNSPQKIAARKAQEAAAAAAADRAAGKAEDVFVRGRMRSAHGGSDLTSPLATRGAGRGSGSAGGLPSAVYVPSPAAAELITASDKKLGTATTKAEILYRYPYSVEPPPQEVSDFCMPLGGKIAKLSDFDSGTTVQEILFGHSHSKRSSRCFIFLLEDKTLVDEVGDEETGVGTNRLYGICVLHPRLVKTPIQNTRRKNPLAVNSNQHNSTIDMSVHGSYNGTAGMVAESEFIEFESMVCYAFLTRFPLFDFFFQVIFDLINTERLTRMELAAEHTDSDLLYSRSIYEYLPANVLEEVLARLTKMPPPLHGEKFQFHISPGIKPIESVRVPPPVDFSEHYMNSSEWALPTLLSWMPIESIIWAMSLLLGEAKIVVLGHDYGMVSCAVIGLLVLLRPLDWVSPVIPMLPIKLMDFVESPVPILVGITMNPKEQTISVETIFNRCSDPSNEGLVLSVLDVSKRELFMSVEDKALIPKLCMPGAEKLAARIKECLLEKPVGGTVTLGTSTQSQANRPVKPVYTASVQQKVKTRAAHDVMTKHIAHVAELAVAHQQKLMERRRLVVEMANRMSSPHGRHDSNGTASTLGSLGRSASFGLSDLDDSEDEVDEGLDIRLSAGSAPASAAVSRVNSKKTDVVSAPVPAPAPPVLPSLEKAKSAPPPAASAASNKPAAAPVPMANSRRSILPPAMGNMGTAVTALVPPPPPAKVIMMSKQPLSGNDSEEFLNRFILTQIFSEHMHRQGLTTATASAIIAHPTVPTAATATASPSSSHPESSIPLALASPISNTNPEGQLYTPAMDEFTMPSPVGGSPDFGNTPNHKSMKGGSPLSPGEGSAGSVGGGNDALALEFSPRNDMAMRRRSVDMAYLLSSGKLTDHSHEHEHTHALSGLSEGADTADDGNAEGGEDSAHIIQQSLNVFSGLSS